MKKILVTAIGSFSGNIILTELKKAGYFIVGCDTHSPELVANSVLVDKFYKVCLAIESSEYIEMIKKICLVEDIDAIIPLTDPEVDVLNSYRNELPCKIYFSKPESIKVCRDKYLSFLKLNGQTGINTIDTRILSTIDSIEHPSIIKPRTGRSSEGIFKVYSQSDMDSLSINSNDYIIQPIIDGTVVTVDVIRSANENSEDIVAVPREELVRTNNGAGLSVRVFSDSLLEKTCKTIAKILDVTGCVCFEFIKTEDGKFFFLECNPRFSAGISFTCHSGYNGVINHIKCFENDRIESFKLDGELYFGRFYQDVRTR